MTTQIVRDLAGTLAELGVDASVTGAPAARRAEIRVWSEVDARVLLDALASSGRGECGGIESCVWGHGLGFSIDEVEVPEIPLHLIVLGRLARGLRRWARVGAVS